MPLRRPLDREPTKLLIKKAGGVKQSAYLLRCSVASVRSWITDHKNSQRTPNWASVELLRRHINGETITPPHREGPC